MTNDLMALLNYRELLKLQHWMTWKIPSMEVIDNWASDDVNMHMSKLTWSIGFISFFPRLVYNGEPYDEYGQSQICWIHSTSNDITKQFTFHLNNVYDPANMLYRDNVLFSFSLDFKLPYPSWNLEHLKYGDESQGIENMTPIDTSNFDFIAGCLCSMEQ